MHLMQILSINRKHLTAQLSDTRVCTCARVRERSVSVLRAGADADASGERLRRSGAEPRPLLLPAWR